MKSEKFNILSQRVDFRKILVYSPLNPSEELEEDP